MLKAFSLIVALLCSGIQAALVRIYTRTELELSSWPGSHLKTKWIQIPGSCKHKSKQAPAKGWKQEDDGKVTANLPIYQELRLRTNDCIGLNQLSCPQPAQRQIEVHTIHLYQDQCTMTCLSGWTAYNFTCLQFINVEKNWIEAEVYCQSLVPGGHLASIHSEENNDFVLDLLQKENSSYQKVWIGSSDKYKDDTQFWTDGSRWDYHNWFTGKPIAGSQCNTMNLVQVEKLTMPQDIAQQEEKAIQLLKPVNIELVHDGVSSRGHPLLVLK